MMTSQKFLAPIYGLSHGLKRDVSINSNLLIRNIKIPEEINISRKFGLQGNYPIILEIIYEYDPSNSNEPFPGISLNVTNKFEASLNVFGDGQTGIAAVLPDPKQDNFSGGYINFSGKVPIGECLEKDLDDKYIAYYDHFSNAYDMRPVAFDVFRRSQERFSTNDKTIDSCIVLESIFVPPEERSKRPFILNGMKIMGFDSQSVNKIAALINYRNALIHANRKEQLKLLSKYTHVWFEEALNLVRNILYKFVQNPWV